MIVFAQQHQAGAAIAVEIAGGEGVGAELAVVYGPPFGRAPAVGALVVEDDQFLGVAVVGEVGPAIAVQIRHDQRGDAFFRGDGVDAEAGVGRQFVDFPFHRVAGRAVLVLPVWL